jgi:hypothetical protein
LFAAVLGVLVLALLEAGARLVLWALRGFDGTHLYQYVFDPYKNILPTPRYVDRRGVRHNSQGFRRDSDVSRVKPPGTYRIFLMGASTAYGMGGLWPNIQRDFPVLDNSQTIDAYLERQLHAAFPAHRFEVINAAITSTWTHHHLVYLNQAILGYDPDMVLFLDGFNDFYFFNRDHDQFADYSYSLPSRVIMGPPTLYSLLYANGWWLFQKSAFAHLVGRGLRTAKLWISNRHPDRTPLNIDSALAGLREVFPRNALKMQRRTGLILGAEGVRAVFMLQPLLILERDRTTMTRVERRMFDFNLEWTRPNYEEFMRRAVQVVVGLETQMARDVSADFIDLTGIFKQVKGQVYTDYAHLTPHGNEVLAGVVASRIGRLIAQDLAAMGRVRPQSQEPSGGSPRVASGSRQ